jgi:hypothetical protein
VLLLLFERHGGGRHDRELDRDARIAADAAVAARRRRFPDAARRLQPLVDRVPQPAPYVVGFVLCVRVCVDCCAAANTRARARTGIKKLRGPPTSYLRRCKAPVEGIVSNSMMFNVVYRAPRAPDARFEERWGAQDSGNAARFVPFFGGTKVCKYNVLISEKVTYVVNRGWL